MLKLFFSSVFLFCALSAQATEKKTWNILVYWGVNNDLYEWNKAWLHQFEKVGSSDKTNIIVQYANPKSTDRFFIKQTDTPIIGDQDLIASELVMTLPKETNSADPQSLEEFVQWASATYPAEKIFLVIGSHGFGWRGVVQDDTNEDLMAIEDIKAVLEKFKRTNGKKMDMLLFDACDMGLMESVKVFQGSVGLLVASPFEIWGIDYILPLMALKKNPKLPTEDFAKLFVHAYARKFTGDIQTIISLFNPTNVDPYMKAVEAVATRLNASPERLIQFNEGLNPIELPEEDLHIDFVSLMKRYRNQFPEYSREVEEVLSTMFYSSELNDDLTMSFYRTGYPRNGLVLATGLTHETADSSGVALTCSSDPEAYASSTFGKLMPQWSRYCESWKDSRTTVNKQKFSLRPRRK